VLVSALTAVRARSLIARVSSIALMLGLGMWLETFRTGSRVITLGGAAVAYASRTVVARWWLAGLACALALAVTAAVWQRGLPAPMRAQLQASARYHRGHVFTPGHAYKLLDQRFYSSAWTPLAFPEMSSAEAARYVTRAVVHFLVEPIPWRMTSNLELAYVPELVIWYVSVLLVPFGIVAGLRRDALLTCMLGSYSMVTAGIVALNGGNIGTLVRHRALVAPYLGWICAVGCLSLIAALRRSERAIQS